MDPLVGGLIGSAVIGTAGSFLGQRSANRENRRSAREMMDFQERMSSTAYQRSVADKRAAGINPLYGLGTGASTPGGAMSSAQNELQNASSNAMDIARGRLELENIKAQNRKIESEVGVNDVMKQVLQKDAQVKAANVRQIEQNIKAGTFSAETGGIFDSGFLGSAYSIAKGLLKGNTKLYTERGNLFSKSFSGKK